METQFVTDEKGIKTAAIVPLEEWERMEKAKDLLEHVYLAGIIEERKTTTQSISLDELLNQEGITRADLEN